MEKPKITRSLIHTISKFSNWDAAGIDSYFRSNKIYADKQKWIQFLRLFLLSLGVAFTAAGVIFFFAYNWADLHKFAKLGLVQGLIGISVIGSILLNADDKFKGIILTGATMMVGALFAVFGQIYQTGANAYDFFLGWTIFVAIWVFISNFPPLWFIFLILINLTLFFYSQQLSPLWLPHITINFSVVINIGSLILLKSLAAKDYIQKVPKWLEYIVALCSIAFLTWSFIFGLFEMRYNSEYKGWYFCILLLVTSFPLGVYYGKQIRDTFYLAAIGFAAIIIGAAFIFRVMDDFDFGLFLLAAFFVIISVTLLVIRIISLKKEWHGNRE